MHHSRLVLLAAAIAAVGCSRSDEYATTDSAAPTSATVAGDSMSAGASMTDAQIVGALVSANTAEIEAGKLAQDSASSADVKSYAKMLVTDHMAMNDALHNAASQLGVPSTAGEKAEDILDDGTDLMEDLKDEHGADFDKEFLEGMIESHEKTLKLIDRASSATSTATLDSALTDARAKVQHHLDEARRLRDSLSSTAS